MRAEPLHPVFVGDDASARDLVKEALNLKWPTAQLRLAANLVEATELIDRLSPNMVLVQARLNDESSATAVQAVRTVTNAPILVLGNERDPLELATAIAAGADAFAWLPVSPDEVAARILALLRRPQMAEERTEPRAEEEFYLDPSAFEVNVAGRRISLTSTEFRMLDFLVQNRATVASHQDIELAVWGVQVGMFTARRCVQRLRRKLGDSTREPRWIINVHGRGYRYIGPPPGPGQVEFSRY